MNRGHSRTSSGSSGAAARRALVVAVAVALAATVPYVAAADLDAPSLDSTPDAINDTPNGTVDGVGAAGDNATAGTPNGTGDGPAGDARNASNGGNDASDRGGNASDPGGNASNRGGDASDRGEGAASGTGDGPAGDARNASNAASDARNATTAPERGNATPSNATVRANASVSKRVVGASPGANGTVVNVTVDVDARNASGPANVSVPVNLTERATRDDAVAVDAMDVSLERSTNFTLEVTSSDEPIPNRTPAFDTPANGTVGLGFLSVNHSVPDSNIDDVTFTFRVSKTKLDDEGVADVALYRYHDGSWNDLPTEYVRETDTHYVFRAESPGLSEFAAGKKTATFEIRNATVTVTRLRAGDDVQVRVRITNTGGADGTFDAALRLDGDVVATRSLTIAANGTRQTTFEQPLADPGTYNVTVNEFPVGSVEVEGSDRTTNDSTAVTAGQPGFGVAHAALAAVVAALVAARRGRRYDRS